MKNFTIREKNEFLKGPERTVENQFTFKPSINANSKKIASR